VTVGINTVIYEVMAVQIAVCDDERIFLEYFKGLLVRESFVQDLEIMVYEYAGGEELLEAYRSGGLARMDVLFLDIRMEGMDGLETARRLREAGARCLIVFLTSMEEYARAGYEVRAFRYLLKEQVERELGRVMEACRLELGTEEYFMFSCGRRSCSVRKGEILYFESRKRVIYLFTAKESYQFYQKLDVLEEQLSGDGFLRCHRSFLVQERYVKSWTDHALWLENGVELPISRTCGKEVNRRLMLRMGR